MKYAFVLVLLGLATTPLFAGDRCTKDHAHRSESTRPLSVKPPASRVEAARPQKVVNLTVWQRAVLFDPQVL